MADTLIERLRESAVWHLHGTNEGNDAIEAADALETAWARIAELEARPISQPDPVNDFQFVDDGQKGAEAVASALLASGGADRSTHIIGDITVIATLDRKEKGRPEEAQK